MKRPGKTAGEKKRILLCNDDGVEAEGLRHLAQALEELAELWVVAPDQQRSGHAQALSLHRPVKLSQLKPRWHTLSGTPVDCVFMAFLKLMKEAPPDVVVAGINHGANLASDIFYSGTVAIAREAALRGVPAIAYSLATNASTHAAPHFEYALPCARRLTAWALAHGTPGLFLNVNIPNGEKPPEGEELTRLGVHHYRFEMREQVAEAGERSYCLGLSGDTHYRHEPIAGTDCVAVHDNNRISISPLSLEADNDSAMAFLKEQLEPQLVQPWTRGKEYSG